MTVTSPLTIKAIEDNNMIFVSAQPDSAYFHWQAEIYLYQFSKLGNEILNRCYAVFGYRGATPSPELVTLSSKFAKNIICYKDERDTTVKNHYIPSIRPHVLTKFFKEYPHLGKNVFYHDSDIFIIHLPKFELMLSPTNDMGYLSDTVNYIGSEYIITQCGNRYKTKYPDLPLDDVFTKMCNCLGISPDLVKENNKNSGGAQYLLKNIDADYWSDVEKYCVELYNLLKMYETTYPIDHHIQSWTTDMWCVLWCFWKRGNKTIVHDELDFSWATGTMQDYFKKNIFHLAGVTRNKDFTSCEDKFYKGDYSGKSVFKEYIKDNTIFDHISKTNATYGYVNVIKEYVNKNKEDFLPEKEYEKFEVVFGQSYDGVYTKDTSKLICGKPIWRLADGKYLIFHNAHGWTLTSVQYENEIGANSGGFASNATDQPYNKGWNLECIITLM